MDGTTPASTHAATQVRGESRLWRAILRGYLNGAPTALMAFIRRRSPSVLYEEFEVRGRRTGVVRRYFLGLYDVDGRWYAGHPNGTSQWLLNVLATGECTVTRRDGVPVRVAVHEVTDVAERERAIRASARQPAPTGLIYRAAQAHIRAVGRFVRLDPLGDAA